MSGPQAQMIAGERLHLQHGPIDLIIGAWGADRQRAFAQAQARFQTVLSELVDDLDLLRQPIGKLRPKGAVAQRMLQAVLPHSEVFVTPMAAVAGAVADEICDAMCLGLSLNRAYVNNGGDISFYLAENQQLVAAIHSGNDAGRVTFHTNTSARGLATSGWRGRSHSLGIADAVTVVARTAAAADVAATLIANAVDLPGHPAIERQAACDLSPDSDLGKRPVTTAVAKISASEIDSALAAGMTSAHKMIDQGLIAAAALFLQGRNCDVGELFPSGAPAQTGEQNVRLQTA